MDRKSGASGMGVEWAARLGWTVWSRLGLQLWWSKTPFPLELKITTPGGSDCSGIGTVSVTSSVHFTFTPTRTGLGWHRGVLWVLPGSTRTPSRAVLLACFESPW